ncbi:hypothetical protein FB107DRAFT_280591 [Schizophyllum commune]
MSDTQPTDVDVQEDLVPGGRAGQVSQDDSSLSDVDKDIEMNEAGEEDADGDVDEEMEAASEGRVGGKPSEEREEAAAKASVGATAMDIDDAKRHGGRDEAAGNAKHTVGDKQKAPKPKPARRKRDEDPSSTGGESTVQDKGAAAAPTKVLKSGTEAIPGDDDLQLIEKVAPAKLPAPRKDETDAQKKANTAFQEALRRAQLGSVLVPSYAPDAFGINILDADALQRSLDAGNFKKLYEMGKNDALLPHLPKFFIDIIVDPAQVDPTCISDNPNASLAVLRRAPGFKGLVDVSIGGGNHRFRVQKKLWLEAVGKKEVEVTDEVKKDIVKDCTWGANVWDKAFIDSCEYGRAIMEHIRSNNKTDALGDTEARVLLSFATAMDTAEEGSQLMTLKTNVLSKKVSGAVKQIMGSMPPMHNFFVDLSSIPLYTTPASRIEIYFNATEWQDTGKNWGELLTTYCAQPKFVLRILEDALNDDMLYTQKANTPMAIEENDITIKALYSERIGTANLGGVRLSPQGRILAALLAEASEGAFCAVDGLRLAFSAALTTGYLTGWTPVPELLATKLTQYRRILVERFRDAVESHNASSSKVQIKNAWLVCNAFENIMGSTLTANDAVGPLRWTTRLPFPCPKILITIMSVFRKGERIDDASVILTFLTHIIAPGFIHLSNLRPRDDVQGQEVYTPLRVMKLWMVNAMVRRKYQSRKKNDTEEKEWLEGIECMAEAEALSFADLVLIIHKRVSAEDINRMATAIKDCAAAPPIDFARLKRATAKTGEQPKEKRVLTGEELRNTNIALHLQALLDSWSDASSHRNTTRSMSLKYVPTLSQTIRNAYNARAKSLPSLLATEEQIFWAAAQLIPYYALDPLKAPPGTGTNNRLNFMDRTVIPALIQYALKAGDLRAITSEIRGLGQIYKRVVRRLQQDDMLGGDWLPWTDDAQICSVPVDVAPTPTAEVSDITNMDAVQEIPDNVTLRAKNRIDQLNATQATMKSIVKSAAKLLKDYQAGAPKDVFTFSEETVDAMVLLNKRLATDIFNAHGGTEENKAEVVAGKLKEDEAALRRYTRKVSVEQVALMAKKRENPTREVPKAKGGRKRAAVSSDSEDDKGEGSSKGKARATKAKKAKKTAE